MVIAGDLAASGEHTIQYTDDVLWNCTPEPVYFCEPMSTQYIQLKINKTTPLLENKQK